MQRISWLVPLILVAGCGAQTWQPPEIMLDTHKVWLSSEYMLYLNNEGYGCGNIERANNGWVYNAKVINWRHGEEPSLHTSWNSFEQAEKWVEQWCKVKEAGDGK